MVGIMSTVTLSGLYRLLQDRIDTVSGVYFVDSIQTAIDNGGGRRAYVSVFPVATALSSNSGSRTHKHVIDTWSLQLSYRMPTDNQVKAAGKAFDLDDAVRTAITGGEVASGELWWQAACLIEVEVGPVTREQRGGWLVITREIVITRMESNQ